MIVTTRVEQLSYEYWTPTCVGYRDTSNFRGVHASWAYINR